MSQGFSNPIKRIHHLHPAPHEVAHIAGRQHQLAFDGGGGNQHVWSAAGDALGLELAAQCAAALGDGWGNGVDGVQSLYYAVEQRKFAGVGMPGSPRPVSSSGGKTARSCITWV